MRRLALIGLVVCGRVLAADCAPGKHADWMARAEPLAAAVRPADCLSVQQTPPDFSWPELGKGARYRLRLTYPGGETRSAPAPQNWANWNEVLRPGTYTWTVTASDASGTRTSEPRRFVVSEDSKPFLVPEMGALLAKVKARPHPRGLPDSRTLERMVEQRAAGIASLRGEVNRRMRTPPAPMPSGGSPGANSSAVSEEVKRTLNSLAAYALTRDEAYYADSLRRLDNLASWDPEGATAYYAKGMNQSARALTWALALGYDWLYPKLDRQARSRLLAAIGPRLKQLYDDGMGARSKVASQPRDSHGQLTVLMTGIMATLLAGDLPEAEDYARDALPLGINLTMPWGGEDGGFANGTPYAIWDVGASLSYWYVLRWASGVDLGGKAWVRNFTRVLAYFNPPGTPARLFGDGHADPQLVEQQARFGKGLVYFSPSPLGRWYASRLSGEDSKRFEYLMAPPADFDGTPPLPPGAQKSLYLPSIGWVAMHSDLGDSRRTSVYFKSSPPPFGAFNHQHADQNAFVINSGGERLAIESGYYDGYKSKHWRGWAHTTRAKNAITYDGGQGQVFFEDDDSRRMGYGAITRFASAPEYDIVTGDAASAYDGALTQAQRSIVYLRPNLIVVHDRLASARPRRWEWNIHALRQMAVDSERAIRIESGGQSLCVEMLSGPELRFTQTSDWTDAPTKGEAQWHGKFSTAPLPAAEFIAVMSVGCAGPKAVAAKSGERAWTVTLGERKVRIDASGEIAVGR